ncbi:MAG: hypothetical protein HC887_12775 [Desulfobacteraceae bacterium]|nr:hypothetical protein [Desulfobacteraceae bacterium]
MARYEVFVSNRWPEPVNQNNFPSNKYINEEENISETLAYIITIIAAIFWAPAGIFLASLLPQIFDSNWIYWTGFIWFPYIVYNAINLWFRHFKASGRAKKAWQYEKHPKRVHG